MKPSIPKGTRDFSPEQVNKRNFIFNTIRRVFTKYGYQPIETPVMENLSTLTGKYGEEGDRLLFKVLNNGDFLAKADEQALVERDSARLVSSIARRGLRYDLTVPFARYVVMYQNDLTFPFKRYQIQPVWRGDRPQKGRYQEFYQCDVDVVGSDSLLYEAELMQIYDEAFAQLGLEVKIKINNRKVLAGIAEAAGIRDRFVDMTVAIDKLDKIGLDGVKREMIGRGITEEAIGKIIKMLSVSSLDELNDFFTQSETGRKGIEELSIVFDYLEESTLQNEIKFDVALARGLNYYTGCIFEVETKADIKIGSLGGGGRYDDLTSVFGLKNVSGVGISFGAARIYDLMEELEGFPEDAASDLKVLFLAFDEPSHRFAFRCLNQVRAAGVNAEIYPEPLKMKKQMKYADNRKAANVVIIGSEEMNSGLLSLKNMTSGEQEKLPLEAIIERLR